MKAFVAGATGETGRRIVKQLVDRGIQVRAFVRDEAKAREILPEGVEIVTGDVLQAQTLKDALKGCTVVFCATGAKPSIDPTQPYLVDFEGTKNLVNAAKAEGIEQFVLVTSLCVSKLLHPLNLFWGILVWKKWAEEYLQRSGLTYTIVRPGGLKNDDNDDRIIMKGMDSLFDGKRWHRYVLSLVLMLRLRIRFWRLLPRLMQRRRVWLICLPRSLSYRSANLY